jgi:hypothetical protein
MNSISVFGVRVFILGLLCFSTVPAMNQLRGDKNDK